MQTVTDRAASRAHNAADRRGWITDRALGADHVLNYRMTPDWPERVRDLAGDAGAELIVEVAGTIDQ